MSNVTMKRRTHGYYGDIMPKSVILKPAIITIVALVVAYFFTYLVYIDADSAEKVQCYNQAVEKINSYPQHERELIKEVVGSGASVKWDEETQIEPKEASWIVRPGNLVFLLKLITCILAPIFFSFVIFVAYWLCCSERRYLADFPFNTVYGWILFILCLPTGWLFLIVSLGRMRRDLGKARKAEQAKDGSESIAEDSRNEEVSDSNEESENEDENEDEDEDDYDPDGEIDPADFDSEGVDFPFEGPPTLKASEEQYLEVVSKILDYQREATLESIESDIACAQSRIASLEKGIQEHQDNIGNMETQKAQIAQLVGHERDSDDGRQRVLDAMNYILGMRGVREITLDMDTDELNILIRVWVPYRKVLYDFGDYRITLGKFDGFKGELVRSGTREGCDPLYPDSTDGFCFGERYHTICDYINEGRIIEGLTLIIDSMHSVNDMGDARAIPDIYSRVDGKEGDEE